MSDIIKKISQLADAKPLKARRSGGTKQESGCPHTCCTFLSSLVLTSGEVAEAGLGAHEHNRQVSVCLHSNITVTSTQRNRKVPQEVCGVSAVRGVMCLQTTNKKARANDVTNLCGKV